MDFLTAGTSLFNSLANVGSTMLTNKANKELAQYSFDQQRQMIAEQNAYNSPVQQIKRYEEAGLNPALIYGNGASSAGNQSSIAKYEAPRMEAPKFDFNNLIGQIYDNRVKLAQLQLLHQEHENKKEEQFKLRAERHAIDINNMYNSAITGFDPGLVTQAGDLDKVKDSLRFKTYDQGLRNLSELYQLRESQKALNDISKQVKSLDKKQKQYYLDEIQPLMKDILERKSKGMDIQLKIQELTRKYWTADKWFHYGTSVLNSISSFIKPFSFGSLGGSPYQGPWYGTNQSDFGW